MRSIVLLICCSFIICANTPESDKLLIDAMLQDQSLVEITGEVDSIRDKQEKSRVFTEEEIGKTIDMLHDLVKGRDSNMSDIIKELKYILVQQKIVKKNRSYIITSAEYKELIALLRALIEMQEIKKRKRELLEKQEKLLEDTKQLDKETKDRKEYTPEDADKFINLAEEQEKLKDFTKDKLIKEKMDDSTDALQKIDPKESIKKQEEIIERLKKDLKIENRKSLEKKAKELKDIIKNIT